MTDGEIYDKYRYLGLWIESWIYDKSDSDVHIEQWENNFPYPEDAPFSNNRKEWRSNAHKAIVARLTQIMIDRFKPRGIAKSAGDNGGTIDWSYKILRAFFDFKAGCAEADVTLYKEIKKRLDGYRKQIVKLEARRDELRKIKERTDTQIDELRDTIRRLEKLFKIESGDIDQLNRLKERCPDIEEYV